MTHRHWKTFIPALLTAGLGVGVFSVLSLSGYVPGYAAGYAEDLPGYADDQPPVPLLLPEAPLLHPNQMPPNQQPSELNSSGLTPPSFTLPSQAPAMPSKEMTPEEPLALPPTPPPPLDDLLPGAVLPSSPPPTFPVSPTPSAPAASSLASPAVILPTLATPAPPSPSLAPSQSPEVAPTTAPITAPTRTSSTLPASIPTIKTSASGRLIVINVPARRLELLEGLQVMKSFPVGVGRPGFPTPLGRYTVIRKVTNPGWENPYLEPGQRRIAPGKDNPLGTRWIGFKQDNRGEYGIHGTDDPSSVGKYSSHGCVRMQVKDAETLFDNVDVGVPVVVRYEPVVITKNQHKLLLTVYPDVLRRGVPSLKALLQKISRDFPSAKIKPGLLQKALRFPTGKPTLIGQI